MMKPDDRRALVRTLSDEEYNDIMAMCSMLPHVDIEAETQGGWSMCRIRRGEEEGEGGRRLIIAH